MEPKTLPKLLTTQDVADYLGVSRRTVEDWRVHKKGPRYIVVGRHVRYPESALVEWVEQGLAAANG